MVRKTKEEALETRARLLDAAEQVFHRQGVARTSLAEIALEAGLTRGAIYWHFANKADLYDAMIKRVFQPPEDISADDLGSGPAGNNPLAWVRAGMLGVLERLASDPHHHRVAEIAWHKCEYVGEMAQIRDRHVECGNRHLDTMERALAAALAQGQLAPHIDPRQAAVGLMALVDGLMVNWTLDPSRFPLDKFAEGIVDSYLDGLRSKG